MIDTVQFNIWGRSFNIPIEYDCYEGEVVTPEQLDALRSFLSHTEWLDKAKSYVASFCRNDVMEDKENEKKDNIFSYIKPKYLFVKRDPNKPRVVVLCNYRYDPEHGLAIVFSYDGTITVGSQDMIL